VVPMQALGSLLVHCTHTLAVVSHTSVPGLLKQWGLLLVHSTQLLLLHTAPLGLALQSELRVHSTQVCASEQNGLDGVDVQSPMPLHSTPPQEPSDWQAFLLPHKSLLVLHATHTWLALQIGFTPPQFELLVHSTHWWLKQTLPAIELIQSAARLHSTHAPVAVLQACPAAFMAQSGSAVQGLHWLFLQLGSVPPHRAALLLVHSTQVFELHTGVAGVSKQSPETKQPTQVCVAVLHTPVPQSISLTHSTHLLLIASHTLPFMAQNDWSPGVHSTHWCVAVHA
jgi:hypothetical protein